MKKIRLVTEEMASLFPNQTISDLKKYLEKRLSLVRSESEVLNLLEEVNQILQTQGLTLEDRSELKSFRQKIYDRRKKHQTQLDSSNRIKENSENSFKCLNSKVLSKDEVVSYANSLESFLEQIWTYIKGVDMRTLVRIALTQILFAACALITMWFVWKQSIPLYESNGFSEPKWCAFGAIIMIVGASLIHALTKSKIALLLCLYASSYEVILIVKGTVKNEAEISAQIIEQNKEVVWLKKQVEHNNQNYQTVKSQFENPSSKVFQNPWYKQKFVDPAWQDYSNSQEKLNQKVNELSTNSSDFERDGILKILFRLGLVFLGMISVHHFLKCFQNQKKSLRSQTSTA